MKLENFGPHTFEYLKLVKKILDTADKNDVVQDRTGVGRLRIFGGQMVFDMTDDYFPLVTCKHVSYKMVFDELKWFMEGKTNINHLDPTNHIWDEWALKTDKTVFQKASLFEHIKDIFTTWHEPIELLTKITSTFKGIWYTTRKFKKGDIGPMYGKTWRDFDGVDQLKNAYELLKTQPFSARVCVSAWDPKNFPITDPDNPALESDYEYQVTHGKMALNPCHAFFQFFAEPMHIKDRFAWMLKHYAGTKIQRDEMLHIVDSAEKITDCSTKDLHFIQDTLDAIGVPDKYLSLKLYQRSMDVGLGASFNIASYALLLEIFAASLGMIPKTFIHSYGDAHIYRNQIDVLKKMLSDIEESDMKWYQQPSLTHRRENLAKYRYGVNPWDGLEANDWALSGYTAFGTYRMKVAA